MLMLKKYIPKKEIPYLVITLICGTFSHFLYAWTHFSPLAALFCPINESTWEHLKLLFFPFLFMTLIECARYRGRINPAAFFYSRFLGVICGMSFIVIGFYTYTGITGTHSLFPDILLFITSVFLAFAFSAYLYKKDTAVPLSSAGVSAIWLLLCLCFFIFTCFPPEIPLFLPPG